MTYTFTEDTRIGADGEGEKVQYPLYVRLVVKNLTDDTKAVPMSIKDKFSFNITAENKHLRTENNVFDTKVFTPARITWRESTLLDRKGTLSDYGALGEYIIDSELVNLEKNYAVAGAIRMDVGDSIKITSTKYDFLPFVYDKNDNYLGYIDMVPDDPATEFGTEFVFTENTSYGSEGKNGKVEGPVYVKLLIATKNYGVDTVSENIREKFVFDIKTPQEPQEFGNKPAEKPQNPVVENNFDKDLLSWSIGVGNHDSTGEALLLSKTEYDEEKKEYIKVPDNNRYAMTAFLEVNKGDAISLKSDRYSFLIYGYSDKNGTYSANNYIDISAGDKTTNWGNEFEMKSGLKTGKEGEGFDLPDTIKVRILIKSNPNGDKDVAESVRNSFTFDISTKQK